MGKRLLVIIGVNICILSTSCVDKYEANSNAKTAVKGDDELDSSLDSIAKNSEAQNNLEEPTLETLPEKRTELFPAPVIPDVSLYPRMLLYPGLNIAIKSGSGGPNHRCGNGIREHVEQCDDGTNNSDTKPDACRTTCKNPSCGDDVVDEGEECDDGNNNLGDGCNVECKIESLFSVSTRDNQLRIIDPLTGATLCQRALSLEGFTVQGGTGLTADPATGVLWGLLRVGGPGMARQLVTIDPVTAIAMSIGTLAAPGAEGFTGLAFDASGRLFGITGSGGTPSETLFTLNTSNAAATFFMTLAPSDGGDSIAFNSIDGLLYHASGRVGNCQDDGVCFESIDLTAKSRTSIDITATPLTSDVIQALTFWAEEGVFLWKQTTEAGPLFRVTPNGQATLIGNVDHYARGLAFTFIASSCP